MEEKLNKNTNFCEYMCACVWYNNNLNDIEKEEKKTTLRYTLHFH